MTRENWVHIGGTLALLTLTGCRHQARVALVTSAPVLMISVPPAWHPSEPLPLLEAEILPPLGLLVPRQPLPRFRPRPTTARQLASVLPATPSVVLGELSTGGESTDLDFRKETETLLRVQQQRLQKLPYALASQHPQQVEQARLFLKEALEVWGGRDIEAAHVLALKTKLLLDEF